jgi:hypothetical protein
MQHDNFIRSMAAERYLLDEMNDTERREYEMHFFGCSSCFELVMITVDFIQHTRAIFASEMTSDEQSGCDR